jgi:hypothetical protein
MINNSYIRGLLTEVKRVKEWDTTYPNMDKVDLTLIQPEDRVILSIHYGVKAVYKVTHVEPNGIRVVLIDKIIDDTPEAIENDRKQGWKIGENALFTIAYNDFFVQSSPTERLEEVKRVRHWNIDKGELIDINVVQIDDRIMDQGTQYTVTEIEYTYTILNRKIFSHLVVADGSDTYTIPKWSKWFKQEELDEVKRVNTDPNELIELYTKVYDWYQKSGWMQSTYDSLIKEVVNVLYVASINVDLSGDVLAFGSFFTKAGFEEQVRNSYADWDKAYEILKKVYDEIQSLTETQSYVKSFLTEVKRINRIEAVWAGWGSNYDSRFFFKVENSPIEIKNGWTESITSNEVQLFSSFNKVTRKWNSQEIEDWLNSKGIIFRKGSHEGIPKYTINKMFVDIKGIPENPFLREVKRIDNDLMTRIIQAYNDFDDKVHEIHSLGLDAETEEYYEYNMEGISYLEKIGSLVTNGTEGDVELTQEEFKDALLRYDGDWNQLLNYIEYCSGQINTPGQDPLDQWENQITEVKRINTPTPPEGNNFWDVFAGKLIDLNLVKERDWVRMNIDNIPITYEIFEIESLRKNEAGKFRFWMNAIPEDNKLLPHSNYHQIVISDELDSECFTNSALTEVKRINPEKLVEPIYDILKDHFTGVILREIITKWGPISEIAIPLTDQMRRAFNLYDGGTYSYLTIGYSPKMLYLKNIIEYNIGIDGMVMNFFLRGESTTEIAQTVIDKYKKYA